MAASDAVQKLRDEVKAETGLTVSAGVAPNTMLAKVCISDCSIVRTHHTDERDRSLPTSISLTVNS
jgi:nucleotidyltransferase/DNA polymerase involved in DNA repair